MLVVLWVMVLMIGLATEFAFSTKVEVNTTRNYKEDLESYYLAKAGINLAKAELLKPARFHSIHPEKGWLSGKPQENNSLLGEIDSTVEYTYVERTELPLGNGTISYTITDENSKIAINTANRVLLIKILTKAGMEIGEERDIVADSILDWIDADDNHHLNGAEKDYYQKFSPPYQPRNGPLEFLDELLKVRGITKEILYGSEKDTGQYKGLAGLITTYKATPVNPNTASEEVLSFIYSDTQVKEILAARESKGFYNDTLSTYFRITATGQMNSSQTRHKITTVMEAANSKEEISLLIHYWNDNDLEL